MNRALRPLILDPDLFEISESICTNGLTLEEAIACIEQQKIQDLIWDVKQGKIKQNMMVYEMEGIRRKYKQLLESLANN